MPVKTCNLAVYLPWSAAPLRIEGVRVTALPPDEVHMWLDDAQLRQLLEAIGDIAAARAARGASSAIAHVLANAVEGLAKSQRKRKLRG